MKFDVTAAKVVPSSEIHDEDTDETLQLRQMLRNAEQYLSSFKWCAGIKESYFGYGIGGIIGIFLFRIAPTRPDMDVDEWIWVVAGDLPYAYITTVGNPTPAAVLQGYIFEMKRWTNAVKSGLDITKLIPVNVPPTADYANQLDIRLDFFENEILPELE